MKPEERKTGGFSSLGEFLVKVRKACDGEGSPDARLFQKTAGHMETGEDVQGGYLVPEQWADEIYHAALEGAIVRPRATVLNAVSDSLKVNVLLDSDRSSNYFGGITFRWVSEAGSKWAVRTKPALAQRELNLHKLVGSCLVSNELESDYGKFGDFMAKSFGQAIRFEEDYRFIWGTGAGQPLGIMYGGGLITLARQQNNNVVYEDLTSMISRLLPGSWGTAIWLVNPDVMSQWLSLDVVENNVLNYLDMNERKLLGFPFIVTEKAAPLGTSGDVILADFSNGHYLIADREMTIAASRHVNHYETVLAVVYNEGFITDETTWKIVLRVDGQPLLTDDITPKRGANDLGPFVALTAQTS